MTLALLTVLMFAAGLLSAWLSVQVRAGAPWWLPMLGGLASYALWAAATRLTTVGLVVLSAWFDVVIALAFFTGFWYWGREHVSLVQGFGILLLCVGLALINR